MRIGSFCTGIGGLDLGTADALRAAGVPADHAWFSETDPGASAVLKSRFPDVPNHGDLTAFDWSSAEPVDVLTLGFPCQPFSAAGRQLGTADPRHLFPAIVRAVEAMGVRPRLLVVENVPRLATIQGGAVWLYVQEELMRLGYAGVWRIAPAACVGAPHLRRRIVLVAHHAPGREHMRASGVRYSKTGDLLPTPRTSDSRGVGRRGLDPDYSKGHDLRTAVRLLKTPTAQLAVNGGSQHPDKRKAGGHGPTLADEIEHLLPTPTAANSHGNGQNNRGDLLLPGAVALLPTPRATDGVNGGPNQRGTRGDLAMPSAVQPEHWGRYAAAVARWSDTMGAPPAPRVPGRTGERLSARFVEWMMGFEDGWTTDPALGLTNAQTLRCLGNAVVRQFAAHVAGDLLDELAASLRISRQSILDIAIAGRQSASDGSSVPDEPIGTCEKGQP